MRAGLTGAFAAAAVALVASGCGSKSHEFPPAAEPATAPPLTARPAGRVVHLAGMPEGLVADPRTGLVAAGLRNPDRLALVSGRSGRVQREVPVPESPRHLQLVRPGGPVLVPSERANRLAIVSLPRGRVTVVRVGRYPHDAAAGYGRIFVGDERGDTLSVVTGRRVVRRVRAPLQPGGVTVTGGRVAVVAVRERVLAVFDPGSLKKLDQTPAGVGPTHVVGDGTGRLFVVDTQGGSVLVLRQKPRLEIVRRIPLPGAPYGIAADRRRHRLWVTLTARNQIAELTDHRVLRLLPAIRQPNTVAVDERSGRVFVASPRTNQLELIDP